MYRVNKSVSRMFLITVMFCIVTSYITIAFDIVHASTEVSGILGSNTTWTPANSPYVLTGPVLVSEEMTLTIEPGVTVDFNGQYIRVNGTFITKGSNNDRIYLNDGQIEFKPVSKGWDEQTGSGSIFEYVKFSSVPISSSVCLKINSCQGNSEISIGGSSVISNSIVLNKITVAGSCRILNNSITSNDIGVAITAEGESTISGNTITAGEYCPAISINSGHSEISRNTITGGGSRSFMGKYNDVIYAVEVTEGTSQILNNKIDGGVSVDNSSSISDNVVTGKIRVDASSHNISNNTITGSITVGASNNFGAKSPLILNNTVFGTILVTDGTPQILGNTVIGTFLNVGIGLDSNYNNGTVLISDNFVSKCNLGLGSYGEGGRVIFERNSVSNSTYGVGISGGTAIIQNNSLTNNTFGIHLSGSASVESILYNNIQDSQQNNLFLDSTTDANATYNWWGTTNSQAINQTIHDFKNDFDLGTVTFVPILTEPNQEAMPRSNPEAHVIPQQEPDTQQSDPEPEPQQQDSELEPETENPYLLTFIVTGALIVIPIVAGLGLLVHLSKK